MTIAAEITFSNYQENANFFVIAQPSATDIMTDSDFISWVNGVAFPDAKFLQDHDIFHFAFEQGWFHEIYQARAGRPLEKFSSYAFHGEAIIELCSRFFGNLSPAPVHVASGSEDILPGEYLALPKHQPGMRVNRPERIFPILFSQLASGRFDVDFGRDPEAWLELRRMTLIAALVTGRLVDEFLQDLSNQNDYQAAWVNSDFFQSLEFQSQVDAFVSAPQAELPMVLAELNRFLQERYDTDLYKTLDYYELSLEIFYTVFLNPACDLIFQTAEAYLFPTQDAWGKPTLMADLFFLNRSANSVYRTKFGGLRVKDGVDAKTQQTVQKLCHALTLLEGELTHQKVLQFTSPAVTRPAVIKSPGTGNTSAEPPPPANATAATERHATERHSAERLQFLNTYISRISPSTKALIANHMERCFGFCCLTPTGLAIR
jgi:hypothetical protein